MKPVLAFTLVLAAALGGCNDEARKDDSASPCRDFSSTPPAMVESGLYGRALPAATSTSRLVTVDRESGTVTVQERLPDGGVADETVFRIVGAAISR